MIKGLILEYPYYGTISRVVDNGDGDEETVLVYEGEMDEHMVTDEEGRTLQTASYIISIPLTKDDYGKWVVPIKGDKIEITRYDETFELTVDNAEPSQIGGISIYADRNTW